MAAERALGDGITPDHTQQERPILRDLLPRYECS